jgi:hypothetical protein
MNINEYLAALTAAEIKQRTLRGLPRDHVLDMSDFPFRYAADAFQLFIENATQSARQHPDDALAQGLSAYANVLSGKYADADSDLERYNNLNPGEPKGLMRFAKRIDRPQAILPPVSGEWPSKPSLFISCDPKYLHLYGMPLLKSIAAHAPAADVHVHAMGTAAIPRVEGIDLTFTSEELLPHLTAVEYYGAVRLVRFYQALEACKAPLIMIDADGLATADHRHLFNQSHNAGLRVRAGRVEPWNHFSACVVRGTEQSLGFFRTVSDIVLRAIEKPFWGLDQYALFSAYAQEKPALSLFGPEVASVAEDVPGLFWFTAGKQKLALRSSNSPYAQLFRRYAET